jgi:hypothetical protein
VESNEYAAIIKASFDRKPRATVRGGIEVSNWLTYRLDEEVEITRID